MEKVTIVDKNGKELTLSKEIATNMVKKARKDTIERRSNLGWNFKSKPVKEEK